MSRWILILTIQWIATMLLLVATQIRLAHVLEVCR